MNFINRFFLKLALLPAGFYQSMGVNTHQLKAILTTKLIMDDRRPRPLTQASKKKNGKPVSMATLGTMFMSAILGVFYLLFLNAGSDIVTRLTFYFSIFFVMLSLTLIADFTSVLIDVRDNFIILPKPVSDRTFVVARLLHIFIHLCKIVLPMSLPGLIYIGFQYNYVAVFLLLLLIFLLTVFSIFFINALYIVILKLTTPQRFQSIINYVQIIFAIVIYGSYQLFPEILDRLHLENFSVARLKGIAFLPLYWFANSWKVLYNLGGSTSEIIFGVAGVLFPILCIVIVVRYLAPSFNQKLALISSVSDTKKIAVVKTPKQKNVVGLLSRLFTRSAVESASFLFTWKMTARSRDFKLNVYPSMGYLVVYVVVIFLNNKNFSLSQLQEDTTRAKVMIISALYFSSFLLIMAVSQIVYSDKYKAAWIFYTSPVEKPGEVVAGAIKAAILKFYIPIVMVITTIALVFAGVKILPNIVLGLFNVVFIATLQTYVGKKYFPFSTAQSTNVKTGSFLKGFFILFLSGLIAAGHFMIYAFLPVVIICAILSIIASWTALDSIKKTSWEKIISKYSEE